MEQYRFDRNYAHLYRIEWYAKSSFPAMHIITVTFVIQFQLLCGRYAVDRNSNCRK